MTLLYPFEWQHIFIPLLPRALLSYICAPMPFLIGVHANDVEEMLSLPLEELYATVRVRVMVGGSSVGLMLLVLVLVGTGVGM